MDTIWYTNRRSNRSYRYKLKDCRHAQPYFEKLKMDCATCSFKNICDTIEGMRDVHKREEYKF